MKHIFSLLFLCFCGLGLYPASCHAHNYARMDSIIYAAISDTLIPGAVLCVVDSGNIAYLKAYGCQSVVPKKEKMTEQSIFDLASVSKPTGAGSAALLLIQDGRLHLDDPVSIYLPEFRDWIDPLFPFAPQSITIRHLLTHTSGLPSYMFVRKVDSLYQTRPFWDTRSRSKYLIDTICHTRRLNAPGEKYRYSCLNFITLQNVVETIVGSNLNIYMRRRLYATLHTEVMGWLPSSAYLNRIVPTEYTSSACLPSEHRQEVVLRGVVHDPLARVMNEGVSGNAGVFATAQDLARWCIWMMNLSEQDRENAANAGLWTDDDGSLNHTGYTGTCIRLYPQTGTAVILLTSRVHPYDKGNLHDLRYGVFGAL